MTHVFTAVWQAGRIPDELNTDVMIRILKKGAISDCNKWRGITLISVPRKLLCKMIIVRRITYAIDDTHEKEQTGFRIGCGGTSHIYLLSATSSNSVQNGKDSYMSTLVILKRLFITYTGNVYGKY